MKKLTLLLIVALTFSAFADDRKLSKELRGKLSNEILDVIVQYNIPPRVTHENNVANHGGMVNHHLPSIKGMFVSVPANQLSDLSNDPDVAQVTLNHALRARSDLIADTINASLVWTSGITGTGIGVAVIDSGINAQFPDLGNASGQTNRNHSRVVYAENFTIPEFNPDGGTNRQHFVTSDGYGHGTHVAGIIAGNGYISQQMGSMRSISGIAPNAQLIDLQVLDQNGTGTDAEVIAAIEQAIALKNTYNIRVINLSLGRPVYESFTVDPLCQAVEAAWEAGIVVVTAAGNDGRDNSFGNNGYGTINAPGNDPLALTVGAMRTAGTPQRDDDEITTYSSRGPTPVDHVVKPDLVAPGNLVDSALSILRPNTYGTLATDYPQNIVNNATIFNPDAIPNYVQTGNPNSLPQYFLQPAYYTMSGTSMAAGVTSGAVALLLAAEPQLTPDQVKARLMLTASKTFSSFGQNYFNYMTEAQQAQASIEYEQTFVLPILTNSANLAQNSVAQAQTQLQQAQLVQANATQVVAVASQALVAPTAIQSQAQQTSNAALALDQQLWIAVQQAKSTLSSDMQSLQSSQTAANNPANTSAQSAALQAQVSQWSAQVNADNIALQSAITAAKNQDQVLQSANQALGPANNALQQSQNALQQAQNTLINANNGVAQAQTNVAQAQAPGNALAAEQQKLLTLQQQASNYLAMAGSNSNAASYSAQQLTQQAQFQTQYILPGLQKAATAAQNNLNQSQMQFQQAQQTLSQAQQALTTATQASTAATIAQAQAQQTYNAASAADTQSHAAVQQAQAILNSDTQALQSAQSAVNNPVNATQKSTYQAEVTQLTAQVNADKLALQQATSSAKTQDAALQTASQASNQAANNLNQAGNALQQAQNGVINATNNLRMPVNS